MPTSNATPPGRERLACHYLAVAREVDDAQHYLDLDPDWPHLRAALEHAVDTEVGLLSDLAYALHPYWSARGLAHELITCGQWAAVAGAGAGRRRGEGAHLGALGLAYADLGEVLPDGDRPGATGYYEQALAIAREIGDRRGEGARRGNLDNAYKILGDPARARECWTQALAIFEAIEDPSAERVRRSLAGLAG